LDYTIESGSSVSHYRIISAIGAGGMGQVYKAQDLTLERTVALKILPPELVRNDERVRRFMQEAKSASSLNHPNIVTIHEIGHSGDAQESIHFIAMELIDGATLKRRIHDGVTDLRTLLGYFAQAAEGLAKAHAAGIVHRDLKPENIMISRDGFTKVLDFGLAKLSIKKSAADGSMATDIQAGTREGTILGTVSYMSPEQVRGEIVDHRSDIFSFGCVLYEAATRRRPFEGQSDVDVMHSILHDKPTPVDELNPNVPAEVRRIIRRCLAKDPERRYQSMKDLALELSDVVDEFEQLSMSAASRTSGSISQPIPAHPRPRNMAVLAIIAAVLLVVSGAAFWWTRSARTAKAAPGIAYGSMKIHQVTTSNNVSGATISPDGKYIAMVTAERGGKMALSVLQIATNASVQIVPPSRAVMGNLSFTADSNYLTFTRSEGEAVNGYSILYQVPSLGGTPQRLVFDVDTRVSYSPDGQRMAFGRGHPDVGENWLMVANADGSGERKLTTTKRLDGIVAPSWSPDGRTILFVRTRFAGGVGQELVGVDVASAAQRVAGRTWAGINMMRWLPDGKSIVMSATADLSSRNQIWMQPYPDGEPVRVTNDVNSYDALSMTADGSTLSVIRRESDVDLLQTKPGDAAPSLLIPHSSNHYLFVAAARGGTAVTTVANENGTNVGVISSGAEQPAMLTHDGKSFGPSVSADGKTIAFFSLRNGDIPHVYVAETDTGTTRQLTKGAGEVFPSLSPDGSFLIYWTVDGQLHRMSPAGGAVVTLAKPGTVLPCAISPDGKKIVYGGWRVTGTRAEPHLFIADASTGALLSQLPWRYQETVWSPSGDALIAADRPAGVGNILSVPLNGSAPTPLTKFTDGTIDAFAVSPEGKLYIARGTPRSDVVTIRDFR
jgi:serine/threonine protein kinase